MVCIGGRQLKCDNCGIEIVDTVYYVNGYIYNCCSSGCLARVMLIVRIASVADREAYLGGD